MSKVYKINIHFIPIYRIDTEMLSPVTIRNRHFKTQYTELNRQRDVVSSSEIDTLYTFDFRCLLDVQSV